MITETKIAGLVEGLMAIHQPEPIWNGAGKPVEDHCSCGEEYPCRTLCLVAQVLDHDPPDRQISGRWVDSAMFWRGGAILLQDHWGGRYLAEVEAEMPSWTEEQRARYEFHRNNPQAVYDAIDETGDPP